MKTTANLTSQGPIDQVNVNGKVTTNPLQSKANDEEEGLLQRKKNPLQLKGVEEQEPLQMKQPAATNPFQLITGLPVQKKAGINDDKGLENEADVMGAKAILSREVSEGQKLSRAVTGGSEAPVQRELKMIDPASQETPGEVWNTYNDATVKRGDWDMAATRHKAHLESKSKKAGPAMPAGDRPEAPATPWLKVKDLYAGVTMTGNDSWPQIVEQRNGTSGKDNASRFALFTGTHGNLGGQFLDGEGRMDEGYKDSSHTAQDVKTAAKLMRDLGCNIKLIDIFKEENLRKPEALRDAVKNEISDGRVVILAWCYSMEAFKAAPDNIEQGSGDERNYVTARGNTPMKDIVGDAFGEDLSVYERPRGDHSISDYYSAEREGAPRPINTHGTDDVTYSDDDWL